MDPIDSERAKQLLRRLYGDILYPRNGPQPASTGPVPPNGPIPESLYMGSLNTPQPPPYSVNYQDLQTKKTTHPSWEKGWAGNWGLDYTADESGRVFSRREGQALQPNTATIHPSGARTIFMQDAEPSLRGAASTQAQPKVAEAGMLSGIMSALGLSDRQAPVGLKGLAAGGPPPGPRAPTGGMFLTPNDVNQSLGLPQPGAGPSLSPVPVPGKPTNLPMFTPKLPPSAVPPTRGGGSMLDGDWGPGQGARSGPGFEFGGMSSASSPTPSTHRPTPGFEFGGMGGGSPSASQDPRPVPGSGARPGPGASGPYIVQQGDMAYNIAKQILGPNAGHSRLMAFVDALAQANPEAFYGDNKLRAGATLNTNLPPPGPRAAPMGTQGPAPMAGPQASGPAPRGMGRFAPM